VEQIFALGPKIVIVTNGREGVYVARPQEILFHPVKSVPAQNTLGAGDAFGSSFVGTYYTGESIEDSIRAGIINSASVIAHADAKSGLLMKGDLLKQIQDLKKENRLTRESLNASGRF